MARKPTIFRIKPDDRVISGLDIVRAREYLGLTQAEFAAKCGWTQQEQSHLEAADGHQVMPDHVKTILSVIHALK
jgi:transcriptional regulator with XRE-family HTH domain